MKFPWVPSIHFHFVRFISNCFSSEVPSQISECKYEAVFSGKILQLCLPCMFCVFLGMSWPSMSSLFLFTLIEWYHTLRDFVVFSAASVFSCVAPLVNKMSLWEILFQFLTGFIKLASYYVNACVNKYLITYIFLEIYLMQLYFGCLWIVMQH